MASILPDAFAVVLINALVVLSSDVILFLWAYRTPAFKSTKDAVRRQTKRDANNGVAKTKSGRERKLERKDNILKRDVAREVALLRFKQAVVMGLMILTLYKLLNYFYYGKSVAKLPFEPFALLRKVTQRGLETPEVNDCAAAFLLMLCQIALRPNFSLFLGWGPSRKMNAMSSMLPSPQEIAPR